MRIGFIGVGSIGHPMAGQFLAAGHQLIVHDRRPEAAAGLLNAGAVWAASPAEVAAQCDLVATCLPGPPEMEAVCFGAQGLVAAMPAGGLYVDHTTNSPMLVRHVHEVLATKGVAMVDAPVSWGTEGVPYFGRPGFIRGCSGQPSRLSLSQLSVPSWGLRPKK